MYTHGFARVAAVSLPVALADPETNAQRIIDAARACDSDGVAVAVYPELSLSGYSLDDLVLQAQLLSAVTDGIETICRATKDLFPLLIFGAPLVIDQALSNCAVFVHRGEVIAITPKQYLPTYREFYEKRYYTTPPSPTSWHGVPVGPVVIDASDIPGLSVAAEVCEDLWVPIPPSSSLALSGATVIGNLSASPVTVGRARRREDLVKAQSLTTCSAYIYSAAGYGESSNDLSWDGQSLIYQAGVKLAASPRFLRERVITTADVDLSELSQERLQQNSFADNAHRMSPSITHISRSFGPPPLTDLRRNLAKFPFVPDNPELLDADCYEAFNIQVSALVRRMESIGNPLLVIGVSGGLDSTQALLVCAEAMDTLGRPRSDILAFTMPGFGTSSRTRSNAETLSRAVGATFSELDIRPTATQMLNTLDHSEDSYDVTYENIQAGLRTDYLFRIANQEGGIVVGTGDLSELALGWCTYGVGDQMSHYAVNSGLPKTMIQHLIRWVARHRTPELSDVLEDILDTEISPELVPGETMQSTQAIIGPYELQDFTLYYLLRHGFGPRKIAYLATHAWPEYSKQDILHWLTVFHKRFFANQFKRTAIPNGPKLMGGGSLSPRGDWRMPSDALAAIWLSEIEELETQWQ